MTMPDSIKQQGIAMYQHFFKMTAAMEAQAAGQVSFLIAMLQMVERQYLVYEAERDVEEAERKLEKARLHKERQENAAMALQYSAMVGGDPRAVLAIPSPATAPSVQPHSPPSAPMLTNTGASMTMALMDA